MKIERLELFRVSMPLVYPFRTAFGNEEAVESLLVRMDAGGQFGWGESAPWKYPAYSPECAATQFIIARNFLAPRLLGQDVQSGEELQRRLSGIKGNPFAKAAFDLAWWDLEAKRPPYNVTVLPDDLKSLTVLDEPFDPASIIRWAFKPNAWSVARDWGEFS